MVSFIGMKTAEFDPRNAAIDVSGFGNALEDMSKAFRQRKIDDGTAQLATTLGGGGYGNALNGSNGGRTNALMQWAAQNSYHPMAQRMLGEVAGRQIDPESGINSQLKQLQLRRAQQDFSPEAQQGRALEMEKTRAEIENLKHRGTPDPVETMIMQRLQGARGQAPGGGAPAQPQAPTVQPQSYSTPLQPQGNPNLQLIADTSVPQEAPQSAPQAPAPDMIETPYGRMSKQEATELGGMMLLNPKFSAAGKAILDSVQAPAQSGLSKPAMSALDEKAIGMVDLASRLDNIQARYKPEYLTYDTKLKMLGNSWLDSFEATRKTMPPEEARKLEEYTMFRQDATNNLSEYIKQITGAAMGIQEEGRIRAGMPDPNKDSPREFGAKLKNSIRQSKLAVARYSYLRTRGYDENTIADMARRDQLSSVVPIDGMTGILDQRGAQIEQELKRNNPQADPMMIEKATRQRIKQEFGI